MALRTARTDGAATDGAPFREEAPGRRRTLAVPYDVTSSSPLELTEALDGRCDVVWVVDAGDPALGAWSRLLPRLGRVVDVAARTPGAVVDELRDAGVDGVVAFTDSQLLIAAGLAEDLGLEGNPPGVVRALTDKVVQRRVLRDAGLAGPRYVAVPGDTAVDDVAGLLSDLAFPVVVKPRRGSGSRDTVRADDPASAVAHLRQVLGEGACPDLIVEEWLVDRHPSDAGPFADYVSVEAVARRGVVVPLAVTGKFPLAAPCRETGNFLPHHLPPDEADAVRAQAVRAAEALGVRSGALHIEVKLTPDGPRIIEVNGRVGGGAIDALYTAVHGRSLTSYAAAAALGEPVGPEPVAGAPGGGYVYSFFVQAPLEAHTLTRLGNLEGLRTLDGVASTSVNRAVGDTLDWRDGSQAYLVCVRGAADGLAALAGVPGRVRAALDVDWT